MEQLFLPLMLLLLGGMLFMGMRKQKKAAHTQQELQSSLSDGDRVMTTSGLYATVVDSSDDVSIELEISEGVVTTWLRQAVREKVSTTAEDYDETDEDSDVAETEVDEAKDTEESKDSAKVAPPVEHGSK